MHNKFIKNIWIHHGNKILLQIFKMSGQKAPINNLTETKLEQIAHLDIYAEPSLAKQTGIICTIGPASMSVESLEKMMLAGMNVARLNFSHGTHESHLEEIKNIREAVANLTKKMEVYYPCAIALDTKGPEIRTGTLAEGLKEVTLEKGKEVVVTTKDEFADQCTEEVIYVDYKNIVKAVEIGKRIYIDDGQISLVIDSISGTEIRCTIENTGTLSDHKGVNLPGANIDLPTISEKDQEDILFGVEQKVDYIFASFMRTADGVEEIRDILGEDGKDILVISKIENQEGIHNIEAIIEASDGIMIARGDMGIEIPMQKVILVQKSITAKCVLAGKPVICATQMLETMTELPRPARAEVCDVANAVWDSCDCVMLSGESAKGVDPIKTVKIMSKICREAEMATLYTKLHTNLFDMLQPPVSKRDAVSIAAIIASDKCGAVAIIVISTSGLTGYNISKFRPSCPTIVVTKSDHTARVCCLYKTLYGLYYNEDMLKEWTKDLEVRILHGLVYGQCLGFIKPHDKVVTVSGIQPGTNKTSTVRVVEVAENISDTVITPGAH